ncbi:hypothetical protein C1645_834574 [Glomus cerebriforme]|uniref:Uncharacterized protein n=1 Tax=Glomus cerebriforme TaxID=658196 RepID=A0A397SDI5_9GLOM|nr:hypothetical protein C1645_834574 [Glomus cerebriforme]
MNLDIPDSEVSNSANPPPDASSKIKQPNNSKKANIDVSENTEFKDTFNWEAIKMVKTKDKGDNVRSKSADKKSRVSNNTSKKSSIHDKKNKNKTWSSSHSSTDSIAEILVFIFSVKISASMTSS